MIVTTAARAGQLGALGYLDNPFIFWNDLIATVTATNGTEDGGPAVNLTDRSTAKFCYPSEDSGEYRVEFTTSAAIRCVALASHNLAGATVDLEYWTGAAWVTLSSHAPADNNAIVWRFASQNPAKWSINIASAPVQPALAVLMAGDDLVIPHRLYQGYAPPITPNLVEMVSNVSEGGHYQGGAAIERGSAATANIRLIRPDFIRGAEFTGFMSHFNHGDPFFWGWRPNKHASDIFYAWRAGGVLAPPNAGPTDFMSISLPMRFHHDP